MRSLHWRRAKVSMASTEQLAAPRQTHRKPTKQFQELIPLSNLIEMKHKRRRRVVL